jgi:hypothetical protein
LRAAALRGEPAADPRGPARGIHLPGRAAGQLAAGFDGGAAARLRAGGRIENDALPVRLAELARRLGLPHETARRRLAGLVERGHCVRLREGVTFERAALRTPSMRVMGAANLAALRRMFALADVAFGAAQADAVADHRLKV